MDRQLVYLLGAVFALIILYLSLRYLLPLILPFAFGAFLALMLEPIVSHIQSKGRLPRPLATTITIIGAVVVTILAVILLSASVALDVKQIIQHLPTYSRSMIKTLQQAVTQLTIFYGRLPVPLLHAAEQGVLRLYTIIDNLLGKLLGSLGALPYLVLNLVISFIAAYFVSKDRDKLTNAVLSLLPANGVRHLRTLTHDVLESLVGLVWAQIILVTITTLVTLLGLWLLKVPYPVFISLLCGLLDIIPVLGPGLVLIPWATMALIGGAPALALGILLVYVAMIFTRQVLQAKIIGTHTGLHPLAVLVSLYLGIKLFGSYGIILGPFTLIVLRSLLRLDFFANLNKM
ncbi:MAG: sporulation integral membrane protein YtvI [Firmicutes bacterium]|nr:sporulation integral membrane protein YtvI [Bacillota bacterium]